MPRYQDLTGQKFGKLTAIERCEDKEWNDGRRRPQWLCVCDCGNEVKVPALYLKNGHTTSCGCNRVENLIGQKFGKLTVKRLERKVKQPGGQIRTEWLCDCECGQQTVVSNGNLKSGHTTSCGCMRNSAPETLIVKMLNDKEINYLKEYTFKDLKAKSGLFYRFDFALLNEWNELQALIEYQGSQHYTDGPFGESQRCFSDNLKKEYCAEHKIPLYEITCFENIEERLPEILDTVYGNTVPSSKEKV